MSDGPKTGELFSRNYLRTPEKQSDSIRARRRVLAHFWNSTDSVMRDKFVKTVKQELGIDYPYLVNAGYHHEEYWTTCEVRDFLSSLTIYCKLGDEKERTQEAVRQIFHGAVPDIQAGWLVNKIKLIREILDQEDLHYKVDDQGGIHYLVDEQFENSIQSTLSGLDGKRFTASRDALEKGLGNLGSKKQSGKALIRGVFEATESAFLTIINCDKVNRLNGQAIDKHLRPMLLDKYKDIPEGEDKVARVLKSFKEWVSTAHPYRHGAAFDEIHEAPLDEAILTASIGMSFIRYLVANDNDR